jgi:hypothetical protein
MKTQSAKLVADPFALMMDPQAVLAAVEGSQRLQGLRRRVYHPLDKPLIPHTPTDVEVFDAACESSPVTTFDDGMGELDAYEQ